jgi:hypothetical protein
MEVDNARGNGRLNILRIADVLNLPDPVWQIDGLIEEAHSVACSARPARARVSLRSIGSCA